MTCNCNEKPCGCNKCDDEWEILQLTPLQSEECDCWWCSPCSSCWTKTWCNCQIESTNDCLTVETTECGIVKLTAKCQKPVVWDDITAEVDETPDKFIVHALCKDDKVKVKDCGEPGYLADLVTAWEWIKLSKSCNNLEISIDEEILPSCEIPSIDIQWGSKLINLIPDWHTIYLSDKDEKYYYAKLTLEQSVTISLWHWEDWKDMWAIKWKWIEPSDTFWSPSFKKNLVTASSWWIWITRNWLYQIWFAWNVEVNYWVHAFRIQMRRVPKWKTIEWWYTILESRYSWPLWREPYSDNWLWAWKIEFVKSVTWWWWDAKPDVTQWDFKIDFPLVAYYTETQQKEWMSQSLWAVVDRIPTAGATIIELWEWDILYMTVKLSTSVRNSWFMHAYENIWWALSVLWLDTPDWPNWWECGFSFYADMIHPL